MESYLQLLAMSVSALLLPAICLWFLAARSNFHKKKGRTPPEPAGAWPLLGHIHLLGADKLQHRTLGAMADKYGPVFCIRLGMKQALVVSNSEIAKHCFTVNDKILSGRPRSVALEIMSYDHAVFGFAPYGPYWRELRKLVTLKLLSSHRLEMLKHVRDSEVKFFVKEIYEQWVGKGCDSPVLVEMKQQFGDMAMNIIVRIIAGKRYAGSNNEESRRCQKAMGDFMHLVGSFLISDAIPFLSWVDVINGYRPKMKRSAREADALFRGWVEEHRQKRLDGRIILEEQDFLDVMMTAMKDTGPLPGYDSVTVIKATCLAMILGGNDTIVATLTWALALLLNNRHVLKKAQDELDIQVGKQCQVKESDVKNLVYLQAIVKETLRLYPAAPLSAHREAMEDCTIAGFNISAGTCLMVNLWKLHRDPDIWPDPLEFQPERFLTDRKDLDVRGHHFELIPFGAGRRICPGITFALQVLHLSLASLLHGFELGTVSDLKVDMTESPGLIVPKATPLEVLLTPRFPSMYYNCQEARVQG